MHTTYNSLWRSLTLRYDDGEAKAIVRLVLETLFGMSPTDIYCDGVEHLSDTECASLESAMTRLEGGEPVQYVLGEADFCGRTYRVAPGVLIPRPETEELCEWIKQRMATRTTDGEIPASHNTTATGHETATTDHETTILDIGTGSGCIAITLALDIPQADVTAWDISDEALLIAAENNERLSAGVSVEKQDALNAPHDSNRWDVIVSNPPYICEHERAQMERHVLDHEPSTALFVPDDDPLLFYRAIARYAIGALKNGGMLFFETNTAYATETLDMLRNMGFIDTEMSHDNFGKPRMVCGRKTAADIN